MLNLRAMEENLILKEKHGPFTLEEQEPSARKQCPPAPRKSKQAGSEEALTPKKSKDTEVCPWAPIKRSKNSSD